MKFEILAQCTKTKARLGRITTHRGEYETPFFMPVGTMGAVKSAQAWDLVDLGFDVMLSNAFHLYLRPGHDLIKDVGGIHKFTGFDRGILTDSGGYQVFSLSEHRTVTDEGVLFKSPVDGSMHNFTPELVMEIQTSLGSDFVMPLDECPSSVSDEKTVQTAVERTSRWAKKSKESFEKLRQEHQSLFGIVQGGVYEHLREQSLNEILEIGFPGIALGGFAVGEDQSAMLESINELSPLLPLDKPHYLMGLGYPGDILKSVALGMDMFDCVLPTRLGRTAAAITSTGRLNMKNSQYRDDSGPLDENCDCKVCQTYPRALINHLVKQDNVSGLQIITWHNLAFYAKLMKSIRNALRENKFNEFCDSCLKNTLIPGI